MDRSISTEYREGDRYDLLVVSDQIDDCTLFYSERMAINVFRIW
jgi:hypothetical protein